MKKIMSPLIEYLRHFVSGRSQEKIQPASLKQELILATIKKALEGQATVHVIYADKDFTGKLIKFDTTKSQIILENFSGSITMIIHLREIKKISILPTTISKTSLNPS